MHTRPPAPAARRQRLGCARRSALLDLVRARVWLGALARLGQIERSWRARRCGPRGCTKLLYLDTGTCTLHFLICCHACSGSVSYFDTGTIIHSTSMYHRAAYRRVDDPRRAEAERRSDGNACVRHFCSLDSKSSTDEPPVRALERGVQGRIIWRRKTGTATPPQSAPTMGSSVFAPHENGQSGAHI